MTRWRARLAWGAAGVSLVAVFVGLLHAQTAAPPSPPWAAQVDAAFAQWDKAGSPGCALGVYQGGRIAYARGYGIVDLEHNVPITPDSVFYAGSVSKQFTAMAAALAISQGKLGADDDVRKYVPELPDYGRPITIRHLIHHTSGLRDINTLMVLAGRRDEDAFDNEAVLRIVARQAALNFMPGDEHLYSNSGYAVLSGRFVPPPPPPPPPRPIAAPQGPPHAYSPVELQAFAGDYFSEELESAYRVSVDGTSLKLRRGVRRQVFTLVAGRKDEFDLPGSIIRFRRGPDGAVTGLVVDADRTRGLAFEKR